MAYIIASTGNDLGFRSLGYYQRNSFPLPTTGMSLPIQPRLGWDGAPYAVYGQPEMSRTRGLNGEWGPPGPPPRAMSQHNGAATYRIDPRTGQYRFYNTDVLPRGVFQQNTFQHPASPALSALGVPVGSSGQQLVQLPSGVQIVSSSCPKRKHACKSGGACKCKGHCKRSRRGMGIDVCGPQPDGSIIPCGPDVAGATDQGSNAPPPGSTNTTIDLADPSVSPINFSNPGLPLVINVNGTPRVVQQTPSPGLFSGSTNIGGMQISNGMLALGAGALVLALANHGSRR